MLLEFNRLLVAVKKIAQETGILCEASACAVPRRTATKGKKKEKKRLLNPFIPPPPEELVCAES